MKITREIVVKKLTSYLHHRTSLEALVDWAEDAMQDGEFEGKEWKKTHEVVARIGLADVKAFGLAWEDCESLLKRLGCSIHLEVVAA